jgi:glycosyltransferase involved in cell wall biosynthesis
MPGELAVIIPAHNEADVVGATVAAATGLPGVGIVIVVDDGSTDGTAEQAAAAGAYVVRHGKNRGKAAAVQTGAEVVQRIESGGAEPARHLLLLDADLGASAADAGPLAEPVLAGTADMTIAVLSGGVRLALGVLTATAGGGIERATGWRPTQPLNGQRCLTRAAFTAAQPLAAGWGLETGLTIDLLRKGMRITEVEVPLSHRVTGNDWRSHLHRLRQLLGVVRALATRDPIVFRIRHQLTSRAAELRRRVRAFLTKSATHADGDAPGEADDDNAIIMR